MHEGATFDQSSRAERVARLAGPAVAFAVGASLSEQVARGVLGRLLPGWLTVPLFALGRLGLLVYGGQKLYQIGSRNPDPLGLEDSFLAGGAAGVVATLVGWLSAGLFGQQRRMPLLGLPFVVGIGFLAGGVIAAVGWVFAGETAEQQAEAPAGEQGERR